MIAFVVLSVVLVWILLLLAVVLFVRTGELARRLQALEQRLPAGERREAPRPVLEPVSQPATPVAASVPLSAPAASVSQPVPPLPPPLSPPRPAPPAVPPPAPQRPVAPAPSWLEQKIRDWLTGGNLVVRVGIIVLFFGVAFLLKYASEHVRVPIELRLSGVALGAIALLLVGWRQRRQRPGFALALQGGAVGVLYLTVFAAFRLYHLLPGTAAFALLAVLGVCSAWLALRQDSMSFAMLGASGGFLAPVLASTGSGSHIALFSYYALLDAGIVAVAWYRAWRPLNLLAFVFTFGIGTLWGVTSYRPELFASTEPFLIFFFVAFLAVAISFARQRATGANYYVDGSLVFGTPLAALGLQFALVRNLPYASAASALALAAVYIPLALWLHRRDGARVRLLVESFLALGIAFLTLAIPLALSGHWTAASWALEGAAVFWMGLRQQRRLGVAAGLLLQLGAAVSCIVGGRWFDQQVPVVNPVFMAALLISLAALASAWLAQRDRGLLARSGALVGALLLAWGVLWWLAAGEREISQHVGYLYRAAALMLLAAGSAALATELGRRLAWPALQFTGLLLLPVLCLFALTELGGGQVRVPGLPDIVAWIIAAGVLARALAQAQSWFDRRWLGYWHVAALWLLAWITGWQLAWQLTRIDTLSSAWALAFFGLPAVVLLALLARARPPLHWPLSVQAAAHQGAGALGLAALIGLWHLWLDASPGDAVPLPFVPLLNPVDLAGLLALLVLLYAQRRLGTTQPVWQVLARALLIAWVALAFLWFNALLLRALHHLTGVSYEPAALFGDTVVQSTLSICWTLLALATMLWSSRVRLRLAWFAGAALMGVVVLKLFAVDLASIGTVARIVSFLGVGLLMLVIGYFSPLPPAGERRPA